MILKKNQIITPLLLHNFFKENNKFGTYDEKFFPLIEDNELFCLEKLDITVIFDVAQICFMGQDELYDASSESVRKKFNLSKRHFEKECFILSNEKHFGDKDTICETIIFDRLKLLWKDKWSRPESYLGADDGFLINIVND